MNRLRPKLVILQRCGYCTASKTQQTKLDDALSYCVQIVRERDYEQYLATLLMPERVRARVFTILALNAEVSTLRNKIKRGSGLASINQLTFWRDSLEMFGQNRKGLLPRQPVLTALNEFGDRADHPLLLNLVSARQETLGDRQFANVHKLEQNSRLLHASLALLQMRALHAKRGPAESEVEFVPGAGVQTAVDAMACAVGILTLIRATVLLLRDGVLLLPRDLTDLHGVSAEVAYRNPNSLKPVVRDLCEISAGHLDTARSPASRDSLSPHLRSALLASGLRADYVLGVLRSSDFNLLDARLLQRHQSMTAWRLWWRHKRQRY